MSVENAFEQPDSGHNDEYWYNYGYDALKLTVDEYAYDETDFGSYGVGDGEVRADETDWDELHLQGSIEVPDQLLEYVLEDGATPGEATRLLVCADCIQTHNRFVAAEPTDVETGPIEFEATFQRDRLAGTVQLSPVLVRSEAPRDDDDEDFRYGQTPGLRLADGPRVDLHVDSPDDESGSFLEIVSKRFEDPIPEDNVFDLEHSPADDPTFYVNSRINLLVPALKNRAPHGSKRWTREVLERLVGHPVWIELVLWTAADIQSGECQHGWQRDVVKVLTEHMYDHDDPDETARDLEERISDPERVPMLVEEINESLQVYFDPRSDLENLFEEVL